MKFYYFFLILIFSVNTTVCQESNLIDSFRNSVGINKDSLSTKNLASIKEYLIFKNHSDTTYIDTSLTIKKFYKFNFLRNDNFEKLKFSNLGQTYNSLTFNFNNSSLPAFSFNSKEDIYLSSRDVNYYHVPTPLTELLFKSVMKQGQFTDVLFSTNTSENFNFSIGFKGMRSLGDYQNILSGLKQFIFSTNYKSENDNYRIRTHYVSQNLENRENGGLTNASILNFESEDNLFSERSKLSVKFENATSYFLSKRYFFDQNILLFKLKNSNTFSLGHVFEYETKYNSFEQAESSEYYGSASNLINDKTELKTVSNTFYTSLKSKFFGNVIVSYLNYNYNYKTNALSTNFKGFKENENSISASLKKSIFNHDISAKFSKNLFGKRLGDLINFNLDSKNDSNINYSLALDILRKHPGFYFEVFDSAYNEVGWSNDLKLLNIKNLFFKINSNSFGSLILDYRLTNNFSYFELINNNTVNDEGDVNLIPKVSQHTNTIKYLKFKWQKEFRFGKFALDNSFIYQSVSQDQNILNLPDFITRNTFYYSNNVFNKAMFFQTGLSFKYFSKYYASEYNPLISSFHVQSEKKIGGFPMIDFFVNAKIKQTRLYLKAEHINSSVTGNSFYSSPSYPYRDFLIRFGLVWNFFN